MSGDFSRRSREEVFQVDNRTQNEAEKSNTTSRFLFVLHDILQNRSEELQIQRETCWTDALIEILLLNAIS